MADTKTMSEKIQGSFMTFQEWQAMCNQTAVEGVNAEVVKLIKTVEDYYKGAVEKFQSNDIGALHGMMLVIVGHYVRLSQLAIEAGYDFASAYTYRKIAHNAYWTPVKAQLSYGKDRPPTQSEVESGLAVIDQQNQVRENALQKNANTISYTLKYIEMIERNLRDAIRWLETDYRNTKQ